MPQRFRPGVSQPPLSDARVGSVLADRYRIDSLVGEGGMGRVYAAEHIMMKKRLAVKVLHRELTVVPEVVRRFEREAMAAANIEHQNVAAATDFGKLPDGAVYLVLEFVEGKGLRDEIAAGPLSVERALFIARQVASALGSAHALDIVHRDLKPENVMLVTKNGTPDFVKVLDFGIAKVPIGEMPEAKGSKSQPITRAGMVFGTPEYMAPEQALGQTVDGRADLYALGVILFEMLSGVRPFSSQSSVGVLGQQLSKPAPTFADRAPGVVVPPHVEQMVLKLLEREPLNRFQTAAEAVSALDSALGIVPVRGEHLFTLAGGSPRSVQGSEPELGRTTSRAGSPPLPSFELPSSDLVSDTEASSAPFSYLEPKTIPAPPRVDALEVGVRGRAGGPMELIERACERLDAQRARLPPRVRAALRNVPSSALLLLFLLAVVGSMGTLAVVAVARPGPAAKPDASLSAPSEQPPPARTSAVVSSRAETQSPTPRGREPERPKRPSLDGLTPAALEELSGRFPEDTKIVVALARAYLEDKEYEKAVATVGRALGMDAKLREEAALADTLFRTAQEQESVDASLALLEGPMQSDGARIIYELAISDEVAAGIQGRAERWLDTKTFQRLSSPELNIAVALRNAKSCVERRGLLMRARNVGDDRSLPYLREFKKTTGCGKNRLEDCNACLREDDRLDRALGAIQERARTVP